MSLQELSLFSTAFSLAGQVHMFSTSYSSCNMVAGDRTNQTAAPADSRDRADRRILLVERDHA